VADCLEINAFLEEPLQSHRNNYTMMINRTNAIMCIALCIPCW